jgi:hypothetical protein
MGKKESFVSNLLRIEVQEDNDAIVAHWSGKSVDRNPGKFIAPILVGLLKKSSDLKKRIILDFQKLDYMNSSTITPVIKILERAKRGKAQVTVLYKKLVKWQELSFTALEIFQTRDKRVEIKGMQ